jgi:hypothetical protein
LTPDVYIIFYLAKYPKIPQKLTLPLAESKYP